jgi:AcrR family transcriptional regulator
MRVAECAAELLHERNFADFTLEEVADRAGTTVQTILRAHGSKEALFVAALGFFSTDAVNVELLRDAVTDGDTSRSIEALFRLYEKIGDSVIRMLAEEPRFPEIKEANEIGRDYHRNFVASVFKDHLEPLPAARRRIQQAAFLAATDIYMWQILRRDEGLSLDETISTVRHIINSLLVGSKT